MNSFIQSYKNKMIDKITNVFKTKEQQMFIASFYCYLKHDSKKDFVIDFDNVWKWLGYTRKNDGKRTLEKHFVLDVDYKVEKTATETSVAVFDEKTFPAITGKPGKLSGDRYKNRKNFSGAKAIFNFFNKKIDLYYNIFFIISKNGNKIIYKPKCEKIHW